MNKTSLSFNPQCDNETSSGSCPSFSVYSSAALPPLFLPFFLFLMDSTDTLVPPSPDYPDRVPKFGLFLCETCEQLDLQAKYESKPNWWWTLEKNWSMKPAYPPKNQQPYWCVLLDWLIYTQTNSWSTFNDMWSHSPDVSSRLKTQQTHVHFIGYSCGEIQLL